jgi:hypothetical protein
MEIEMKRRKRKRKRMTVMLPLRRHWSLMALLIRLAHCFSPAARISPLLSLLLPG